MDYHDVSFTIGARYEMTSGFFVAASYTQFENVPRDNQGKSVHPRQAPPSNGPDAGGRYNEWVGLVNVDVELIF